MDLKIGDGPVVLLNKEYGATGQFNRLWSYKISKLFGEWVHSGRAARGAGRNITPGSSRLPEENARNGDS